MVDLISQSEAADMLGVRVSQVAKFRSGGRLAFVKHANGSISIHRAHVLALAKILTAPRPTKAMSADARELPASFLRAFSRAATAA